MVNPEFRRSAGSAARWIAAHVQLVRVVLLFCTFGAVAILIVGVLDGIGVRVIGDLVRVAFWTLLTWFLGWVVPQRLRQRNATGSDPLHDR